jgi:hypothetical protein
MWFNAFRNVNGSITILSTQEIVMRHMMDFKNHYCVCFGAYVDASEDLDILNTLCAQTNECIALGPT